GVGDHRAVEVGVQQGRRRLRGRAHAGHTEEVAHDGVVLPVLHAAQLRGGRDTGRARLRHVAGTARASGAGVAGGTGGVARATGVPGVARARARVTGNAWITCVASGARAAGVTGAPRATGPRSNRSLT